ncbi:MAG: hypothetical protein ACI4FX_07260 [Agathobacter sp.]
MLTIYCALYPEAKEIIRTFQLKKEITRAHFQVFSDEKKTIRLVLTGVGAIAAATAVAELSALFPPKETDLLLNFGTCGAEADVSVGEIFLCNKLTEESSGRTFYPDMLYRHPFGEAELYSCVSLQTKEQLERMSNEGDKPAGDCSVCIQNRHVRLYDQEAAAVYQAGSYFYGPHRMLFLKAVSDHGTKENAGHVTEWEKEQLSLVLKDASPKVCAYLSFLRELDNAGVRENEKQRACRLQVRQEARRLGEQLHCSVVMQKELEQLLWYFRLAGVDDDTMLEELRAKGSIPARDKKEGKKILDELRGLLF